MFSELVSDFISSASPVFYSVLLKMVLIIKYNCSSNVHMEKTQEETPFLNRELPASLTSGE